MAKEPELRTPKHEALRLFLKVERSRVEISQIELARRLGWTQRTISDIETGDKRVTVLELLALSTVLGFDPCLAIRHLEGIKDE